jgi:PPP family 3-phenylpropionic acid transporter
MQDDTRRHLRIFTSYYFVAFIPWGIYSPYLPLFFQRSGRSDAEIGALLALPPLLMILAPPVWGAAADRLRDRKRVLLMLLAVSALIFPALWLARDSFFATMIAMAVFTFFFASSEPLSDAITMEHLPNAGGDYGRIRLWGSLGFVFPLLLMGIILKPAFGASLGVESLAPVFVLFVAFRLLALAWATRLPSGEKIPSGRFDWRSLRVLASPPFIVLATCAFMSRLGSQGLYVFFSIYLDKLHMADNLKGYFWAIGVLSEVVVMFFAGRIMARVNIKWLFAASLAASAVRLFALSFPLSFVAIALIAPLQGISFAAFHVPAVTFIGRIAPPHLRASGQTLFAAVVGGLGGVVGAQASGAVAGQIGILGLFRAMSVVVLVALVAFVTFFRPHDRAETRPQSNRAARDAKRRQSG